MLPAELIDLIFSFLDILALETCSKADPLFSRLAERHLYAHVIAPRAKEVHNLILENPRFLNYPRILCLYLNRLSSRLSWSIMPIISQMVNLVSLTIYGPYLFDQRDFSTLRNCLQQSSFQKLYLFGVRNLPFSILDDAKNIKQLTLFDCTADEDDPILSSSSSQLSLETLELSGYHNAYLHCWAMRWVARLTTLGLRILSPDLNWLVFPELLEACSNSLTKFHLDISHRYYTRELPFTLSALTHLESLSISAVVVLNNWALPEIIRVVNTAAAPAIKDVVLRFHCYVSSITSIALLDWSLLDQWHLQSNFTGKRPRIDLCVTGVESISASPYCPESILDALAENGALMDLVKRGQLILRS